MKTDEKIQTIITANPFVQMLGQLREGGFVTELTEKIGQTIAAVKRTGKKGKLTITLDVLPDDTGEVRTVDILPDAKTKLPERKKGATTFFVVGEQSLDRRGVLDDAQPEFDFDPKAATPSAITKLPAAKATGQN